MGSLNLELIYVGLANTPSTLKKASTTSKHFKIKNKEKRKAKVPMEASQSKKRQKNNKKKE